MAATIKLRRGSSSAWGTANPVLSAGEVGLDTTVNLYKIGDGSTAWNSLSFWVDTSRQPLDATLTSLAAYNTNGLLTQTAADTFTGRTITPGSSKLSVTNGDGISGNPVLDVVEANLALNNISGTLGIAKGGTGQTTQTAAFDALSPVTTKGDLIVRDSTNNIRVPVGANGRVLVADSTAASGVSWQSASRSIVVTFSAASTSSTTATLIPVRFIYRGTTSFGGEPTSIKIAGYNGGNGTRGYTVQIVDYLNPATVYASSSFTNATEAIGTLSTQNAFPTGETLLGVTLNRSAGSNITVRVTTVLIQH